MSPLSISSIENGKSLRTTFLDNQHLLAYRLPTNKKAELLHHTNHNIVLLFISSGHDGL